jgi:tRNA(Ile)-lysidine synthase
MPARRSRTAPSPSANGLAAADPPPLTPGELDAALSAIGGFEPRPLIAIGVSGGPDSLALTILADRWARARGGAAWGLIVDHRLRAESAAEAETVAGWLAARRIPHAVLIWEGPKPATRIQETARTARHRLLAEWCAAEGCLHLLLAHHREDQAETYLIRHRAGSGVDGLAGMSAVRELAQLRVVRPLLGVCKARLAALLDAENQPYLRDPSNRNPAFARARLRLAAETPEAEPVPALSEHAAARIARERALAALLARAVTLHPGGFAVSDPTALAAAGELGDRALDRIARVIGGASYPLRRERLTRLREALAAAPQTGRTLGGCRFVPWRGQMLVLRELARIAPPAALAPGASLLWDNRFAVSLPAAARQPLTIGPLGQFGVEALPCNAVPRDNPLPRFVYPVLPALCDAGGLLAVPHLGWRRATGGCPAEIAFHPLVSLSGAGFAVV